MKEVKSFLLTTIFVCFTLFSFTGCEDKKVQEPPIAIEDTTEILTQKDQDQQKETIQKVEEVKTTKEIEETEKETITEESTMAQTLPGDTFILSDIQQNKQRLTINDQKITFHDLDQSVVVVNFFSTWCAPCRGEIPYLSDLQEKYKNKIFIAGILVNDKQDDHTLIQFMSKNHANYFISNSEENDAFAAKIAKDLQLPENFPIPLTVIYKDGDYYTHYEGAVPVEMIDHDIQQIIDE